MFSTRPLTSGINVARVQPMATYSLIFQRTIKSAAKKAPAKNAKLPKEVRDLQKKIEKEKKLLTKIRADHAKKADAIKAQVAAKKASEAEAALIKKATKTYRKISGSNFFVKEKCTSTNLLSDAQNQWTQLTEEEKAGYTERANEYNEAQLKIWTPSPKRPPSAYAVFLKENWKDLGDFKASSKAISDAWKLLSEDQKAVYKPSESALAEYKKAYDEWKNNRVKLYKESKIKA